MTRTAAFFTACAFPAMFGLGAWAQTQRPIAPTQKTEMQYREEAAVEMLRLGMMRWNAACAYEMGRRGLPVEAMKKACTIDLGLGEPLAMKGGR